MANKFPRLINSQKLKKGLKTEKTNKFKQIKFFHQLTYNFITIKALLPVITLETISTMRPLVPHDIPLPAQSTRTTRANKMMRMPEQAFRFGALLTKNNFIAIRASRF